MSDQCNYADCEEPGELERAFAHAEGTWVYCEDHDPLEDPQVSDRWEAVEDDHA